MLFASKPYILDLIAPAKSIGELIGQNAKDFLESYRDGKLSHSASNSTREVWSNIITIFAFALFAVAIFLSAKVIQEKTKMWFGIGAAALSLIGIGIYFAHLAIGMLGLVIIAVLVVLFVLGDGL